MLSLILESATERSLIAIIKNGVVLYLADLPPGLHQSHFFLPKIEEGFIQLGLNPQELQFIAVGIGPGSYTGIRVAATVGKVLSYASKIPLIGICSLEGFIPDSDGVFAVMVDARMSGAYILKGEMTDGIVSYRSKPEICAIHDFEKKLSDVSCVIGPSLDSLRKKIELQFPELICRWLETAPNPLRLDTLAREKFDAGAFSLDGSLDILYLKNSSIEKNS